MAEILGAESTNVLRREVAVRLRSGLRASDVVASIGADTFAVLLAWIDSPVEGSRVAGKLAQPVIEKILSHLGLQARAPPRAAARGQPLQAA